MTMIWIASPFSYFMTNILVKHLPGDFNINILVMFPSDTLGVFLACWLYKKLTVKAFFALFFGI